MWTYILSYICSNSCNDYRNCLIRRTSCSSLIVYRRFIITKVSFNELSELRKIYLKEKEEREKEYSSYILEAKQNYKKSLDIDYVDEYKEKFEVSLNSLEGLYDELVSIYSRTKGLTFSITNHIKTVSPRTIKKGMVEEHFDMLVDECKGALYDINNSDSPEDDIAPIKTFCQGLVDLRYIVANARRLIEETGSPEEKKEED